MLALHAVAKAAAADEQPANRSHLIKEAQAGLAAHDMVPHNNGTFPLRACNYVPCRARHSCLSQSLRERMITLDEYRGYYRALQHTVEACLPPSRVPLRNFHRSSTMRLCRISMHIASTVVVLLNLIVSRRIISLVHSCLMLKPIRGEACCVAVC